MLRAAANIRPPAGAEPGPRCARSPTMTDPTGSSEQAPQAPVPGGGERRDERRHFRHFWNLIFGGLRAARAHGRTFSEGLGLFLVAGAAVAIAGTSAFAFVAGHVRSGTTQRFDDAVLSY